MRGAIRQPEVTDGEAPLDASFQHDNRGKRGIAVAVNKPEGADLVRRLAAGADVFLCNLLPAPAGEVRPGQRARCSPLNPRLVHATLTGYGVDGPGRRSAPATTSPRSSAAAA